MAPERARWRPYFDAAERAVGRPLESGVETDTFQDLLAAAARLRGALEDRLERTSSDLLHMFNLPAQSDIKHLSEQLNRLDKQIRDLKLEVEKQANGSGRTRRRS
jgi:archaellum component FlaC